MLDGCDFDWLASLLALDSQRTPLGDSTRVDLSVSEVASCSRQEVESRDYVGTPIGSVRPTRTVLYRLTSDVDHTCMVFRLIAVEARA